MTDIQITQLKRARTTLNKLLPKGVSIVKEFVDMRDDPNGNSCVWEAIERIYEEGNRVAFVTNPYTNATKVHICARPFANEIKLVHDGYSNKFVSKPNWQTYMVKLSDGSYLETYRGSCSNKWSQFTKYQFFKVDNIKLFDELKLYI